ncbi:MAG: NAD(P)-dependent oxidoreductase [Cyanothece sp. SIO1E1]|nr:NAD(P)-dependent oxidoreductase [Cyanothece sp. SIO1E1]
MNKIAVLGLGAMGSRIAMNLIAAGYDVTVWNRSPAPAEALAAKGATLATSPKLAAEQADVVMSMVADNDASRYVWLNPETGAALGLRQDAIAIASSTLTVDWTKALAAEIERRGAKFLDAPVVGSRPQAEARKLIYLVGGEAATLAQVKAILSSTSGAMHHIGPIGQGMAMKLAVNTLFGVQVVALAEVIGMLDKQGITSTKAMAYLSELPVTSLAAKGAGNLIVADQHAPMFPIELVEKDFRYALQTGQAVNAATPTATAIHTIYQEAIAQGYGNENITGIARLFL